MGYVNLKRTVAPTVEPLKADLLRVHLRQDGSDEDAYLKDIIIPSARISIERATGLALVNQTWEWYWDGGFPAVGVLRFPLNPLSSVVAVKYLDTDGNTQTWATSNYTVATKGPVGRLWLNDGITWPDVQINTPEVAWIEFVAGHGALAADVPTDLVHLVMLMAEHIYTHRGPVITGTVVHEIPKTLDYMVDQARVLDFSPTPTTRW